MKAKFKNNLPNQTNDVMFNSGNPENPDSNNWLLRAKFPTKTEGVACFWGMFPVTNFESGFTGFPGLQRTSLV